MHSVRSALALCLALCAALAPVPASSQSEARAAIGDAAIKGELLRIAKDLDPGRDQSDALVGESFRAWRNRGRMKRSLRNKRHQLVPGRELAMNYLAFVTTHPGASETPAYLYKAARLFLREDDAVMLSYIHRVCVEAVKESRKESGENPDELVRSTAALVNERLRALNLRASNDRLRDRVDSLQEENGELQELVGPILEEVKKDISACTGGALETCYEVARAYELGHRGLRKDVERVRTYLERGCDGEHSPACTRLGILHATGFFGTVDEATAYHYYKKACDPKKGPHNAEACNNVAVRLVEGQVVQKDLKRAMELFEVSCDSGFAAACRNRGYHFMQGTGGSKDPGRANDMYEKSCALNSSAGCKVRAEHALEGVGGPKNRELAVRYYDRACKLGDRDACARASLLSCDSPRSCYDTGLIYDKSKGVPRDHEQANAFFEKACGAGHAAACLRLGYNLELGLGASKNMERANALYEKACDGGYALVLGQLSSLGLSAP